MPPVTGRGVLNSRFLPPRIAPTRHLARAAKRVVPSNLVVRCVCQVLWEEQGKEAILCQRLTAHTGAVTAGLVLVDEENRQEFITASLDKTVAFWRLQDGNTDELCCSTADEITRLAPEGGPVFSLVKDGYAYAQAGQVDRTQVFVGLSARSIVAWEPPQPNVVPNVVLNGHTGWVRALATSGKWLFSCGCNIIHQWDMSRAVPKHVADIQLFTGDVLGLATGKNHLYSCGADGSIRSWEISKKGELVEVAAREKAHKDRVTGIMFHNNFLYSVSYDGHLKQWDALTLELVSDVKNAHDGERLYCLTVGPDGVLYTGGNDKLVRRWSPGVLEPAASPLFCHSHSVRTLSAGRRDLLLSGDSSGEIALWKV